MEAKKEIPVMEVESEESSTEEAESPRSVVMEMKKKVERIHSQVLRIREEDSHLGEDLIGRDDKGNENDVFVRGGFHEKRRRRVNVVLVSRPILRCSPLSGKNNNVKTPCN